MKRTFLYILVFTFLYGGLNKPSIGENLRYVHILFEWDQEPDANRYNLQVASNQSFQNLIVNIEELSTSYVDTENFTWDNTYFWRVRSIYENGTTGPWVEESYFYTD